MQFPVRTLLLFCICTMCAEPCAAAHAPKAAKKKADWSFLIYMKIDSELHRWALKNIFDMTQAKPQPGTVNILIQWHSDADIAWRYNIKHGAIKPKNVIQIDPFDQTKTLIDAMSWVIQKYPAEHYGIIVWDHGAGCLNPHYIEHGSGAFDWDPELDIAGQNCQTGTCPVNALKKLAIIEKLQHRRHRGLLFDHENKTYMTQEQFTQALSQISAGPLRGSKIDIVATDCCKMAMLEVMYPIRNAVSYFIGAQNCELLDGFNYQGIFDQFQEMSRTPRDVAQTIITTYNDYYTQHTHENTFTQSATDLAYLEKVAINADLIAKKCCTLIDVSGPGFKELVAQAHNDSPHMCQSPYYTDLYTFYEALLALLAEKPVLNAAQTDVDELKLLLADGMALIRQAVVCNATGSAFTKAHGISVYFPFKHIDSSYPANPFAQESAWLNLLQRMVPEKH